MAAVGSRKTVYNGKLIHLEVDTLRLPNGFAIELELIRHPGAALIVPFISAGRIIMLRQFRAAVNSYLYELPAGTLNKGESALSCAKREIVEETGYRARTFTRVGEIYPVPGYSTERIVVFKAQNLSSCPGVPEKDEVIERHPMPVAEARKLFRQRKIKDAKTICALALCGLIG
ncbi:MAG: NUDIX hydrolase [Candidatus Omnitrophica bacterium]|nr:NUDIX hydrolase [Candidatus Omnitrophota bacterium]